MWGQVTERGGAHVVDCPLNLVREHAVHVRHDLHRHVDEALAENETDVVLRLGTGSTKETLQCCVEEGVVCSLQERVRDKRLDRRVILQNRCSAQV